MHGDTTNDSIIWVPGEAKGKKATGAETDSPSSTITSGVMLVITEEFAPYEYVDEANSDLISNFAAIAASHVAALRDELVASGYLG